MDKHLHQQGYDYEFVPTLDSKYECPICYLCLRDTIQTSCGHLFCQDCILDWLNKMERCCPLDKNYLTEEDIFPDNHTRREIQALKVKCPQTKNGCIVIAELRTIKLHESTCSYVMDFCSLGCGTKVYRKDMENHQETCIHSPSQCAYCKEKFPREQKLIHCNTCLSFPISCKYCQVLVSRSDMDNHIQQDCLRAIVMCEFEDIGCSFASVERQHLNSHYLKSLDIHVNLLHQALNKVIQENKNSVQKNNGNASHSDKLEDHVKTTNEMKRAEIKNCHSSQLKQELTTTIKTLQNTIAILERKVITLEEKLSQGIFYWRINNFSIHEQEVYKTKLKQLKSQPFYTNPHGYRLFLRMTLKMNNSCRIIVSLFVHLMQGENDNFLKWPFSGKIDLSILDQKENCEEGICISKSMFSDSKLDAFQKPITEYNSKGFGYKEFTDVSILHTQSYLKNNVLLVKADIRPNVII